MNRFQIHEHGVEIVRDVISPSDRYDIINEVCNYSEKLPGHGIRNADKKLASIGQLSRSDKLLNFAESILGSEPQIVRVIFFDKTPTKNWLVSWHQDKTVSLSDKIEIPGWGPWSIKDGTHHVQPTLDVLNSIVTFRIHLDDADENNGCLKVIPKSHELGVIPLEEIRKISTQKPYSCTVKAGDMVIMHPLLLHSSSKSVNPSHRRVVHIEYSNYELPEQLSWA